MQKEKKGMSCKYQSLTKLVTTLKLKKIDSMTGVLLDIKRDISSGQRSPFQQDDQIIHVYT